MADSPEIQTANRSATSRSGTGELRVFVLYTTGELIQAAVAEAGVLLRNLAVEITLLAVEVVPFPLPLERPPVAPEFLERRLQAIAGGMGVQIDVQLIFARDFYGAIERVLPSHSLVVVATKKRRWWPTAEAKLARWLGRAGHRVALVAV
jgi:hypothetical protein